MFNSILPLNNTSILELGRFFGLSSAAFCCNHAVHLTSLDDNSCDIHSFATLDFFNISEFLYNSEEYATQNITTVSLRHKLIDIIAKEFLASYSVQYIDDAFSPKYLNQRYDFIFEDLVWNNGTMHILDDCIAYLNTYPDCVLIVHDDVRFSVVHERIKDLPYCYDSNFFKQKYNITPNLALVSTKPLAYLSEEVKA